MSEPGPVRTIVGREGDLKALRALLSSGARLVTIHGPPGVGKTTLAATLSRDAGDPAGLVWLDLGDASSAAGLQATVARGLSVDLDGPDAADRLARALRDRGVSLLVLDNVEQLVAEVAAVLGPVIAAAPGTQFLTTSRAVLGLSGETVYELAPLALPAVGSAPEASAAVQLFLGLARAIRPGFEIDDANREAVASIVRRLDGLPLAIELAAARIRILGPRQLDAELADRFAVLSGAEGKPRRHRALRAAIDWSWELLSPAERSTLSQCAVFRGTFEASAAAAVVDRSGGSDAPPLLDLLDALRDESLLFAVPDTPGGNVRLGAYHSVREYALDRLDASGLRPATHARHARYFVAEGQRRLREDGPEAYGWIDREMQNLLAVYDSSAGAAPDGAEQVALAIDALLVAEPVLALQAPGLLRERLGLVVAAARGSGIDAARLVRAHVARGHLCRVTGRHAESMTELEEAAALAEGLGDPGLEGQIHVGLGLGHREEHRLDQAVAFLEKALARFTAAGDARGQGVALGNLGAVRLDQGDLEAAAECSTRAIRIHQQQGNLRNHVLSLRDLAGTRMEQGRTDDARAELRRALQLVPALRMPSVEGLVWRDLALCELLSGRDERAGAALREARARHEGLVDAFWLGHVHWLEAQRDLLAGRLDAARGSLARAEECLRRRDDPTLAQLLAVAWRQLDALEAGRTAVSAVDAVGPEVREVAKRSTDLRIALQLFDRSLRERPARRPGARVLEVGPNAEWFVPPGGRRTTLRSRPNLRRILDAIARQHEARRGEAFAVDDLFVAGWPGEDVTPAARRNRVYVAVSTLRRLGLRREIVRTEAGYLLDPDLDLNRRGP